MANDEAVQATNDDASLCKRFAVHQGYWKDPYIHYFVKSIERKAPEINRGYYARTLSIFSLVAEFVKRNNKSCQVVNLGAGFDTTFWKLKEADLQPANYIEVDFKNVTSRKCYYISRYRKQLLERIYEDTSQINIENSELYSPQYKILMADLRDLPALQETLTKAGLQYHQATLFVTECVLVYLEPGHSQRLIEWVARSFPVAAFLNYEPVNMADRFGQVMVDNLKKRHCQLLGVDPCTSLQSQRARFSECGWSTAVCVETMWSVYHQSIPPEEKARIEKLEFLDEVELLEQLMQHYCLCLAINDPKGTGLAEMQLF